LANLFTLAAAFMASPAGQALEQALIAMLLSKLTPTPPAK